MEKQVRPALRQRLPRRRRQPASADPVRRQRRRRAAPRRGVRRRDPRDRASRWAARITGEHGVGVEKLDQMCVQFIAAEREQMLPRVKRAFDPRGLLNPGKVIPTLPRCAEYGKMHVAPRPAAVSRAAAVLMRRDLEFQPLQRASRRAALRAAQRARATPLRIRGGGTKDFYGEPVAGELLDTRAHRRHRRLRADRAGRHRARPARRSPSSKRDARRARPVPAVRAAALRRRRDGRRHGRGRAVGPAPRRRRVACATSCSAWRMLTRRGELLRFGGRVMKNVAGYDVSRAARPARSARSASSSRSRSRCCRAARPRRTLRFEMKPAEALRDCSRWGAKPLPLDASAGWKDGKLLVRLRGAAAAVDAAARSSAASASTRTGLPRSGTRCATRPTRVLRRPPRPLWRLSLPPTAPLARARRRPADRMGRRAALARTAMRPRRCVRDAARAAGGHATLFRAAATSRPASFHAARAAARCASTGS